MVKEHPFTSEQLKQLENFVTNTKDSIFVLKNLPEVIKGALFSRYSRSYLGLRELLLRDFIHDETSAFEQIAMDSHSQSSSQQQLAIKKAQDFYDRILDGYGDDSIGELGGAHLAVEEVSMIAAKAIEDKRIGGSPLEKSTRYIYFDRKIHEKYPYYREPTLMAKNANLYEKTCDMLFQTYSELSEPLTQYMQKAFPQDNATPDAAYGAALRAKVLDCLRGLLPAATLTNMGVFGNGRFFESLLTDLEMSELGELHSIAQRARDELAKVIPSFIRRSYRDNKHFKATEEYQKNLKEEIHRFFVDSTLTPNCETHYQPRVKLIYSDSEATNKILASLIYEEGQISYEQALSWARSRNIDEKEQLFSKLGMIRKNRRHKSPRALEHAFFSFEIEADFGVWRDLQRHRMLTQQHQQLSCDLGYTISDDIIRAGLKDRYEEALHKAKEAFEYFKECGSAAQYIVPMAYHLRWNMHVNLRALQWLCELRSAPAGHAQYRFIAQELSRLAIEANPALRHFLDFVDYEGHPLGRLSQETRRIAKQEV